jgi:hypothetical protein
VHPRPAGIRRNIDAVVLQIRREIAETNATSRSILTIDLAPRR